MLLAHSSAADRPDTKKSGKGLMSIEDSTSRLLLENKIQQQMGDDAGANKKGKKKGQTDRLGDDKVINS